MTTIDETRVKARIEARKEANAILELISETTMRWADDQKDIRRHFLETIDATVHAALFPPAVEKLFPTPPSVGPEKHLPGDVVLALDIIDDMEAMAMEVPDAGHDFAMDVLEKARSIGRTIERSNSVTAPQMDALENMRSGLARWIRD